MDNSDFFTVRNDESFQLRPTVAKLPTLAWHLAFWAPRNEYEVPRATRSGEHSADDGNGVGTSPIQRLEYERGRLRADLDRAFISLYDTLQINEAASEVVLAPESAGEVVLFQDAYKLAQQLDTDGVSEHLRLVRIPADELSAKHRTLIDSGYRTIALSFLWRGVRFHVRCELHTEYFTMSTLADLGSSDPAIIKHLDRLDKFTRSKFSQDEIRQTKEFFYHEFWSEFVAFLYKNSELHKIINQTPAFKFRFCDFRGVALSYDEDCSRSASTVVGSGFVEPDPPTWGTELCENTLDFVTNRDFYECTASYMAKSKILYMSDLGGQGRAKFSGVDLVKYILFIKTDFIAQQPRIAPPQARPGEFVDDHRRGDAMPGDTAMPVGTRGRVNYWQIGRVLNRINMLGTLRLAALKNVSDIQEASKLLSLLEPSMNDARADLRQEKILEVRENFDAITRRFLERDATKSGLQYRIERSRYYVNRFRDNVKSLRIGRVEGYQQYNDFVERRSGDLFDFIDRVGGRYERAARALALIEQNFLENRLDEASRRTVKTGENVKEIQKWGEFILIGFLLPYYLVSFIEDVKVHKDENESNLRFIYVSIASLLYVIAAIKFVEFSSVGKLRSFGRFSYMIVAYAILGLSILDAAGALGDLNQTIASIGSRFMSSILQASLPKF